MILHRKNRTQQTPLKADRRQRLPREARDTLFMLGLIAWIIAPQWHELPWWCMALVVLVLVRRGWAVIHQQPLPKRRWVLLLLFATSAATWFTYDTLLGPEAGVTLVISLLALKTLELRARRDALVVFFLGFFILLTAFFHSQSLWMAMMALTGTLGLLTALINAHRPAGHPPLTESARLALKLALTGAPVMIALFVFFPRFEPLWGMPGEQTRGRTGLSSSMRVGEVAELAQDNRVAMRLRFLQTTPPTRSLYFRGPVLDAFDGRGWTSSDGDAPFSPTPQDIKTRGESFSYEATLEPNQLPWLLALDVPIEKPQISNQWRTHLNANLQWITHRPVTQRLRYKARSYPNFSYATHLTVGGLTQLSQRYLTLPEQVNPRTLQWAKELRAQIGDNPESIVRAALKHLADGGYVYTLEPGVGGRDSADEFWFDSKQGFCEHISSAFAVLMRAANIPARIVMGFQGGESNPVDGYWMVRNADAHAWVEVWLADRGWVRVDPTAAVAPARIEQGLRLSRTAGLIEGALEKFNPRLLIQLRNRFEAVSNRWDQWILGYDQDHQLDLLRQLGWSQPDRATLLRILAMLMVLATTAIGAGSLWHHRRARRDPWSTLLDQARLRLRRVGVSAPSNATPRLLAEAVRTSALPPSLRADMVAWLIALERQRYDASHAEPSLLATLKGQFRQFDWPRSH